jgi:hypothetical protein
MNEVIYSLPVPSTALLKDPEFQKRIRRTCALVFEYENEVEENVVVVTIIFSKIEAFRCTYHMACSLEIVQNAYDKVIDCGNTEWLKEIKVNLTTSRQDIPNLSHLAIYFDDGPTYEFICQEFFVEKEFK